ncbi:MAG: T9SS type A sorting domain-containing protein [Bacteroidales bacterium]|nr:T9SS type A sorting domain-containing protein [Bacteroidales bacterium]
MKKIFLFFFITALSASLFAQAVDHFVNVDSEWYTARIYPNPSPEDPYFVQTKSTHYGFIGDTLINNEIWVKMYSSWDTLFYLELHFQGFIHSSDGIVVFRDVYNNLDTLYNFNLNVGDSVFYDFGFNSTNVAIIDIDSILINGVYFKRFYFDEPFENTTFEFLNEIWIEGIGSVHGPLFPHQPELFSSEIPDKRDLTCSFTNGFQYFNNPSYDDCFINIILGIEKLPNNEFDVYPNPFKNVITIENANFEYGVTNVTIYNILGNKIYSEKIMNNKQSIVLEHLPIGVYYVRINQGNKYQTKAVIKLY